MSNTNKLSLNRATIIVSRKYPNMKPVSVVDYNDVYVFTMTNLSNSGDYDNLKAVRKDNGKVFTFNPLDYDVYAYVEAIDKNITFLNNTK